MAYNVPTVTTNNISFGPAVVYIGDTIGTEPTTEMGAISEDGVSIEMTAEKRYSSQGNPMTPVFAFTQTQGVKVSFTALEWDFDRFTQALGAGLSTSAAPDATFKCGGDPLVGAVTLKIDHFMATSADTMTIKVWKAFSDMGLTVPLGQEEHQFEMSFTAATGGTDWSGATPGATISLIEFSRDSA